MNEKQIRQDEIIKRNKKEKKHIKERKKERKKKKNLLNEEIIETKTERLNE